MSEQNDKENLLNEILDEAGASEMRDVLLYRTLRHAKRRRAFRQVRTFSVGVSLVLALAVCLWRMTLPSVPAQHGLEKPYVLVRTHPLAHSALVQTQPLADKNLIASRPSAIVGIVATRPEYRKYDEIDDATLLAFAGNRAVLVKAGPNAAELVFVAENNEESSGIH